MGKKIQIYNIQNIKVYFTTKFDPGALLSTLRKKNLERKEEVNDLVHSLMIGLLMQSAKYKYRTPAFELQPKVTTFLTQPLLPLMFKWPL